MARAKTKQINERKHTLEEREHEKEEKNKNTNKSS